MATAPRQPNSPRSQSTAVPAQSLGRGDGSYVKSIVDLHGHEVAVCEGDADVEICDDY
jgi:hypothetical protein